LQEAFAAIGNCFDIGLARRAHGGALKLAPSASRIAAQAMAVRIQYIIFLTIHAMGSMVW
jgi:hypothetical protein